MFNKIKQLASQAFNTLKNAVTGQQNKSSGGGGGGGGWGAPAPKPAPNPVQQFFSNPVASIGKAVAGQKWLPAPVRNVAAEAAAAAARAAAEAARIKEENRRRVQGQLDQTNANTRAAAGKAAAGAMDWIKRTVNKYDVKYTGDWSKIFDKSGNYKNQGGVDGWLAGFAQRAFDPDVKKAKADWQNWYNNSQEGQTQKATDDFERVKQEYAAKAKKIADGVGKNNGGFGGWVDNLTGADDRRKKKFAEDQLKKLQTDQIKRYENKLNDVLKWQATNKATLEKKKFESQAEYDAYLKVAAQEKSLIDDLEYTRAATTGSMEGYGKAYEAKGTNTGTKVAGWFGGVANAVQENPIFKYTLGSGSENIPSLVTAPSRAINWFGNVNSNTRDIYKHGGETSNRLKSGKNAWQETFNQRNFNIRPYTDKAYDRNKALTLVEQTTKGFGGMKRADGDDRGAGSLQRQALSNEYAKAKNDAEREKVLRKAWDEYNRANRNSNSMQEFAADPLFFLGVGKAGKGVEEGSKWLNGATKIAQGGSKLAKPAGWFVENANKIKAVTEATKARVGENKVLSWLGKEAKNPQQVLAEKIDAAKLAQGGAQKNILERVNQLNKKLLENPKLDTAVFDDIAKLSDKEVGVLKRLTNGELSARDKIKYWTRSGGLGSNPAAAKIKEIAARMDDFSELMRKSDMIDVAKTSYGKTAGKVYLPSNNWLPVEDYNFRMFKKGNGPRTAEDLKQSYINRYFKSNLDDSFAAEQTGKKARRMAEREQLLKQYDDTVGVARKEVEAAYKKTRTPFNRARALFNKVNPLTAWKHSALGRPAWTVNNAATNTVGGVLASGGGSLVEQAKMLRPKYWKKAMAESKDIFGSNIGKELPKTKTVLDKWYNFNSGVEDWSRVAAGRAALKKGMTEEQALGRVNKYLFDYKTANWERPLKTAIPFWQWSKNLSKASAKMPFDQPVAAAGFNRLDRYQNDAFDKDFESMRGELKKQGYSDEEIDQFKEQSAKYYKGRLKIGDKYITTPFNAYSQNGLGIGINPFIQAGIETGTGKDRYGRTISSDEQGIMKRIADKFPQYQLGKKALEARAVATGKVKPTKGWIGEKGSEGYGLTKEKQGYDKSKSTYDPSLDPRAKLGQDTAAFFGVPRAMTLDKKEFVATKKLARVAQDYFNTDWKKIEADQGWDAMNSQREKFFKDRGVTSDEFYGGVLSKNDTANTIAIKKQKSEAVELNKKLFAEYQAQPKGTRSAWAADKLRELNKQGYFDKNPFLKSFDWLNPETIARADKSKVVRQAIATGDWSAYRAKYGSKQSQKSVDYARAKRTGDWSQYRSKWGTKAATTQKALFWQKYFAEPDDTKRRQLMRENPQYAKTAPKTEAQIAEARFWASYAAADPTTRKQLLSSNPQYNKRSGWTDAQWDEANLAKKTKDRARLRGWGNVAQLVDQNVADSNQGAKRITSNKGWTRRPKKVVWRV